jgi:hypothetical protein
MITAGCKKREKKIVKKNEKREGRWHLKLLRTVLESLSSMKRLIGASNF